MTIFLFNAIIVSLMFFFCVNTDNFEFWFYLLVILLFINWVFWNGHCVLWKECSKRTCPNSGLCSFVWFVLDLTELWGTHYGVEKDLSVMFLHTMFATGLCTQSIKEPTTQADNLFVSITIINKSYISKRNSLALICVYIK